MNMEVMTTTIILMLAQVLPIFCNTRQIFEQILGLRNLNTSDVPILNAQAPNTGSCGRLCFQEPSCSHFRFQRSTCSLYDIKPTASGDAEGTIYFKDIGSCPKSSGYMLVESRNLCFKPNFTKTSISNAHAQCELEGGRVIILTDNDTYDFVHQWMLDRGHTEFWVGLRKTSKWLKWTDGSEDVRPLVPPIPLAGCGLLVNEGIFLDKCNHNRKKFICEIILLG